MTSNCMPVNADEPVIHLRLTTDPEVFADFGTLIPGPGGGADGALLIANKLAELSSDPQTQLDAQAHLGLGVADPLAYYILAKS
ncbi:hypothetical protein [Alicycliphilus denitrificans]|uniref:hypothetical protein n=1 Tax=Alicycliphilus denitrificans TaxID=179636 RepID=UPI0001D9F2A2|nr:hypothetical protein [Alicycliphilus denitrificans]ADU99840.1 hypothetical protein Alide_2097 [Alicycliphilus denitrificans BC]